MCKCWCCTAATEGAGETLGLDFILLYYCTTLGMCGTETRDSTLATHHSPLTTHHSPLTLCLSRKMDAP